MHPELLELLPLAGIGAAAAFLTALAKSHRLELPRVVRQNGEDGTVTLVDLGSLAAPLLGMICAVAMDGGPRQAMLWGMAAGIMGPAVLNTLVDPLLARLGMPRAETQSNSAEARTEGEAGTPPSLG